LEIDARVTNPDLRPKALSWMFSSKNLWQEYAGTIELRLWEVSVVTFPMNEVAMVTSVKSIDDARRVLREAPANPDEQAALRALKAIRALLDPEETETKRIWTMRKRKKTLLLFAG